MKFINVLERNKCSYDLISETNIDKKSPYVLNPQNIKKRVVLDSKFWNN